MMRRHILSVAVSEYKCSNPAGFTFLKNVVTGETGWQNYRPTENNGSGQLSTLTRTKLK
jgi:hypothetical protein